MNSLMTFLCVLLAVCLGYVVCVPADSDKGQSVSDKDSSMDLVKRDWSGMKAAWGKRADEENGESSWDAADIPQRQIRGSNSWQSGLGAWGKRSGDWGQNLRAWGKRTPQDWNNEYIQTLQRQMEAVKNRRASNWQLASWGRRR